MATRGELPHRVFFTSGREELVERVGERVVARGREERRAEFRRLERLLVASLTSTLVATKYSAHAATGAAACRQLGDLYRGLLEAAAKCQVQQPGPAPVPFTGRLDSGQAQAAVYHGGHRGGDGQGGG